MMKAEVMKQKRTDNKGFSLVELIIVMAIMAILVGIVGTQAIPYMNRARESKDREILSAIGTAAVAAYTQNAEKFKDTAQHTIYFKASMETPSAPEDVAWQEDTIELAGYNDLNEIKDAASSDKLGTSDITITLDIGARTVTVHADGFEDVVSRI